MNKGYVIMAQNTKDTDYLECAEVLKSSILRLMPNANVLILKTDDLPYGDLAPESNWKLVNDWQVYEASPFEHTIKIEADMFVTTDIDYWWDVLQQKDICISTNIRNYKGNISETFKLLSKQIPVVQALHFHQKVYVKLICA